MLPRPRHKPEGDPCHKCGEPAARHLVRVYHVARPTIEHDDICECGSPVSRHKFKAPKAKAIARRKAKRSRKARGIRDNDKCRPPYPAGIDGEGEGRNPHRYTLLAWSNESGDRANSVASEAGLSSEECLDFILSTPNNARLFAFQFSYDLTKILADLPNKTLFELARPELRKNRAGKIVPVRWRDYELNLVSRKFTVRPGNRTRIIWDVFKFYQSSFVDALSTWNAADPKVIDEMRIMKGKRGQFDREDKTKVSEYCFSECRSLARLVRFLGEAHAQAGIPLKQYFGAGSTAGAMLGVIGLKPIVKEIRENAESWPLEVLHAIACAFFGGRFETAVVGPVADTLWEYDISSAYPYQICRLPCLIHGRWEWSPSVPPPASGEIAIVKYRLRKPSRRSYSWGPFPLRLDGGSIAFPIESAGGWVWISEYRAASKLWSNIEPQGCWIFRRECDCRSPFESLPAYYVERLKWGKAGKGIVLKLGYNSVYGKLAQSIGNAPFNCWAWAGMVTAGTRAQILEALALHDRTDSLLSIATDGIITKERLDMPDPVETGTMTEHQKPLGGWEEEMIEGGMFFVRPGIHWRRKPGEVKIKARGLGRSVLIEQKHKIEEWWKRQQDTSNTVEITKVVRFKGFKSSIHKNAAGFLRSPTYGEWIEMPVQLSFNPLPKRESLAPDGKTLTLRRLPECESKPYTRARSEEALQLLRTMLEVEEQPELYGDDLEYHE